MNRLGISLFAALFPLLTACTDSSLLTGKVVDNFGKPLSGAVVAIENTELSATTDQDGTFSLRYVPGAFRVSFNAQGHGSSSLDLDIKSSEEVPLKTVELFRVPPPGGIFLVGESDYVPLARETLAVVKHPARLMESEESYLVQRSALSELPPIELNNLRFVDTTSFKTTAISLPGSFAGDSHTTPIGTKSSVNFRMELVDQQQGYTARVLPIDKNEIDMGTRFCFLRAGEKYSDSLFSEGEESAFCLTPKAAMVCDGSDVKSPVEEVANAILDHFRTSFREQAIGYTKLKAEMETVSFEVRDAERANDALRVIAAVIKQREGSSLYYVLEKAEAPFFGLRVIDNRNLPAICKN